MVDSTTTTLLISFVSDHFGLTSKNTLLLSKVTDILVSHDPLGYILEKWVMLSFTIVTAIIVYGGMWYFRNRRSSLTIEDRLDDLSFRIYDHYTITSVCNVFSSYPDILERGIVDVGTKYDLGGTQGDAISKVKFYLPTSVTKFRIEYSGNVIMGTIYLIYEDATKDVKEGTDIKTKSFKAPCVIVSLENGVTTKEFLNHIDSYGSFRKAQDSTNNIVTYEYQSSFYDNNGPTWMRTVGLLNTTLQEHNPQRYITSHFFEGRDKFFRMLNSSLERGEQFSCLLHGPGGTGKSSMGAVIANALGRNLVIFDMRHMNRLHILKNIIEGIQTSTMLATRYTSSYKESVIFFDEFDNLVKTLVYRKEQEKVTTLHDGNTFKAQTHSDANTFKLEDLKTLLQGAAQIPGLVMVGTTNDIAYIKSVDENLIRFGRMTPWKFDYISNRVYLEIVEHYFPGDGKSVPMLPEVHDIPTAEIITYAKMSNGDIAYFGELMASRIEKISASSS